MSPTGEELVEEGWASKTIRIMAGNADCYKALRVVPSPSVLTDPRMRKDATMNKWHQCFARVASDASACCSEIVSFC